jgi:hypothetical protein
VYHTQACILSSLILRRREDLEDILNDPAYFQSIFHSLPQVKELYQAQAELGMANEAIAREFLIICWDATRQISRFRNKPITAGPSV